MRILKYTLTFVLATAALLAHAQTPDGFIYQPLASGKALPGTTKNSHASTVVELKNGGIMAAWFGGTKEGAADVAIYGARLHNGVWSAPTELARAAGVPCWNPVLFHT